MIAPNALTDRLVELASTATSDTVTEMALYGAPVPDGFRVLHHPLFRSTASGAQGALSFELAAYLRRLKPIVHGEIGVNVLARHFWDEARCYVRVALFEVYPTLAEAQDRLRSLTAPAILIHA